MASRIVTDQIIKKRNSVLGLATGKTMVAFYSQLVEFYKNEGIDFSRVKTFNLDEYVGIPAAHPASYHSYMYKHFFKHVNIKGNNIHIPDGKAPDVSKHCQKYEKSIKKSGGIDLQMLGIGTDGHIAFNEPVSSFASRTRIKTLTDQTQKDNSGDFVDNSMPIHVITMGIGTIMESKKIILIAFGEKKAKIIGKMVEGPISAMVPASILQTHPNVKVIVDQSAASNLQRKDYYHKVFENRPAWQKISGEF